MTIDADFAQVRTAFDLMDTLDRFQTGDELRDALLGFLRGFGVTHFTITQLPQPRERLGPHMILSHWPQAWLAHYDRNRYYRHDPVGRHCFATLDPFLWAHAPIDVGAQPLAARVMGEAAEHGLAEGICIPIHDVAGFQAVFSAAGERLELSPNARRAVHLLAYYAHGAALRLARRRRSGPRAALSPRERDVLTWLAAGQTLGQVGATLGISDATATTHLRRAREKLGTSNATHTVVEALRQHEIRL
ncbi:helix-turn-helix transcriptional regulator [Salinarimonas soli]|nr:LuxR family transcriptional regulator [Salinarimonas soli]